MKFLLNPKNNKSIPLIDIARPNMTVHLYFTSDTDSFNGLPAGGKFKMKIATHLGFYLFS